MILEKAFTQLQFLNRLNDNTMRTIALYISGIYTAEQALEQLSFFKVNNQISFHTEKALNYLHWKEDKEV